MLMGNQPWPQFQNEIRERSITDLSEGKNSVIHSESKYEKEITTNNKRLLTIINDS